MGSGALWVLIALLWAAVLIPILWRKQREMKEKRSVDDFQRAMGRLGRTAMPKGVQMTLPARRAAMRRRNVTLLLVALVLITAIGAAASVFSVVFLALSSLLLAVWLILAARAAMRLAVVPTSEIEAERFAAISKRLEEKSLQQQAQVEVQVMTKEFEVDVYVNEPVEIQALTRAESMAMHPATLGWVAVEAPLPAHLRAPAVPVGQRTPGLDKPGSWSETVLEQLEVRKSLAEQLDLDAAMDTQEMPVVAEVPIRRAAGE
jgi:hypothetical protein